MFNYRYEVCCTAEKRSLLTGQVKAGGPPTLLALTHSFHHDMQARMQFDDDTSDSFPIQRGVQQGCIFALTLFGLYFSFVSKTAYFNQESDSGVSLLSCDDGRYFNLARCKARTQKIIIRALLYAGDAAM